MERITKARIKRSNGFSDAIPIGTSSEYVKMQNGSTLEDTIGSTDISSIGSTLTEAINNVSEAAAGGISDIGLASSHSNGLMSSEDWKKLNVNQIPNLLSPTANQNGYVWTASAGSSAWRPNVDTWKQNTATSEGYVTAPGTKTLNKVWKTNSYGVPGWRDDDNTWVQNTINQDGYVTAPTTDNANKVWKTDGYGNPGWRDDNNTWVQNTATTDGYVKAPGTGSANKVWKTNSNGTPSWQPEKTYSNATETTAGLMPADNRAFFKKYVTTRTYNNDTFPAFKNYDGTKRVPVGTPIDYQVDYIGDYTTRLRVKGGGANHYINYEVSDIRLKQNIKSTEEKGLDLINSIDLYQFDWKIEDKKHQKIGFVADYLEKIDPQLVSGGGYDEKGKPFYKNVNTFYLQGFEIKAIQQLSKELDETKEEIKKLKQEIKDLKEEMKSFK